MEDVRKELLRWAGEVEGRSTADWENLPDIGLYMDQVVTYVERQLAAVWRLDREKPLTPAMVNNYANGQMLPRADSQKKYSRDHLAMLLVLCTLKPVMPIAEIGRLLSGYRNEGDMDGFYRSFRETQARAMAGISTALRDALEGVPEGPEGENALRMLALGLAVEANTRSLASERILQLLAEQSAAAAVEAKAQAERDKVEREKTEKADRERAEKAEKAERTERERAEKAEKAEKNR
jgi:hypothetical protein